jgi:hypothetical protein
LRNGSSTNTLNESTTSLSITFSVESGNNNHAAAHGECTSVVVAYTKFHATSAIVVPLIFAEFGT